MFSSRALSSADEGGPAPKKLRSTTRGVEKASKSVAAADDVRSKKARARPALTLVNLFSSAGRRPQPTATSSRHVPVTGSRSDRDGNALGGGTRRSARLMSTGSKPPIPGKVGDLLGWQQGRNLVAYRHIAFQPPPVRDRRRPRTRTRSQSTDSEDEHLPSGDAAHSQSPQSIAQSPRSETSPAPSNWTASHEQAAQEAYEVELADQYIYDLMRLFASATRALAMYNTALCMEELDKLPHVHQRSPYVMAMVGKAHYERTDYTSVCTRTSDCATSNLTSRGYTGGTRLPGSEGTGSISAVGYGGVLDLAMAFTTDSAIVFPSPGTAFDRSTLLASVDSDREHVLIAEGAFPGVDVLSACPATGPHLRVRVHACGA
jgi:hypothetical protein